jgi:DegV family protein with EDD domain
VTAATGIAYLDGERLRRLLVAGIARVVADRGHLDRINVFPVPDGDTGTNLALTLSAVAERLAVPGPDHAGAVLLAAADAALDGARGNSGAIFAQFFQGLAASLGDRARLLPADLARGLADADAAARGALAEPREGTVLTVMRAAATAVAPGRLPPDADFVAFGGAVLVAGRAALAGTRDTLDALRAAAVEDAGALGLVLLFEGAADALRPGSAPPVVAADAELPLRAHLGHDGPHAGAGADAGQRFCTEAVVTGSAVDVTALRAALAAAGSSVVVVGGVGKARLHVHVDDPEQAFAIARRFGTLSGEKADDMTRQARVLRTAGQRVAIVADSGADLPDALWDEFGIHLVPLRVQFGARSFLDKAGLTAAEFFAELARNPDHPKTSQPPPGDYRRAYELLASHFEHVVCVSLTARLSGTHQAALAAAGRMADPGRITVVDSRNLSVGAGLVALAAAEAARAGGDAAAVVAAAEAARATTRAYGYLPDLRFAVRGGRIRRPWSWLAGRLPLAFVIAADGAGGLGVRGAAWAGGDPVPALLGPLRRDARRDARPGTRYRVAIAHGNAPDVAARLATACRAALDVAGDVLVTELGPAFGVHGGPGTVAVGVQAVA